MLKLLTSSGLTGTIEFDLGMRRDEFEKIPTIIGITVGGLVGNLVEILSDSAGFDSGYDGGWRGDLVDETERAGGFSDRSITRNAGNTRFLHRFEHSLSREHDSLCCRVYVDRCRCNVGF